MAEGIDPRLYGREQTYPDVNPDITRAMANGGEPPTPGPQVDAAYVTTGESDKLGEQVQRGASYVEPSILASVGAAISQWDTSNILRAVTRPSFPKDGPNAPTAYDMLQHVPFQLTEAENKEFVAAKSSAERAWLVEQWKERREALQVAGEHPVFSTLAQVIDPVYLATAGVGNLAKAPRMAGALSQGGVALGTAVATNQVAPQSDAEAALVVLANMAGGALISKEGKLVPKDKDFPARELQESVAKPHMRQVEPAKYTVDDFGNQVKVKDAVWEEVPQPLRANASVRDPAEVAAAVEQHVQKESKTWAQKFGEFISWNTNKTMANMAEGGDEIADLLVDNNLKYGVNSVESHKIAIKRDLGRHQWEFEGKINGALAEDGFGTVSRIFRSREASVRQAAIERDVYAELMRRDMLHQKGLPIDYEGIPARIKELADLHGKLTAKAVDELKAAGVHGADALKANPGYVHRVWNYGKMQGWMDKLMASGKTEAQARKAVVNVVRGAIRRGESAIDEEVAGDLAHAIVDRTMRKGLLEDAPMTANLGKGAAEQVRDMLTASGLPKARVDRVVQAITGVVDEAGKSGYLKHRINLDYNAGIVIDGQLHTVMDLLETNLSTLADRYVDHVSSQAAFARKGLTMASDIEELRKKYIAGVVKRGGGEAAKADANELFNNVIAHLQGRPTGDKMNELLRNSQGFNRMITLGMSGLWQATEYAKMMQRYGILKATKYMVAEMPLFREMMKVSADPKTSQHLKDILTGMSDQQLRLRPFIQKFEDNFEMPHDSRTAMFIQQGTQAVPYLNGMKYIHGHQARVHANLVMDVLKRAAAGDKQAVKHLADYGIEARWMDKLNSAFEKHGMHVDKWDDGVWEGVRPGLNKMVDESVLHQRIGDMPAFAQFSQVGKFIFTYRSFVLTAHNKILAGTLAREGLGAMSLVMMYQYPLAVLATQAATVASGKKPLDDEALLTKATGQMGAFGLGAELAQWVTGAKNGVGAPGLIPWDRGIKAMQSTGSAMFGDGKSSKALQDISAMTPFFSIIPGNKALTHTED